MDQLPLVLIACKVFRDFMEHFLPDGAYLREFNAVPGTYTLCKGWLESGSNPLQEYREYLGKYGEEKATWLMDQQYHRYQRLAMVSRQEADLEKYRPMAQEVAHYCQRWGMVYEEILGSDQYFRRLAEVALSLDQADEEFIVVLPGGEVKQSQFIRR